MSERPPQEELMNYDQQAELMDQAWEDMIVDRLADPATKADARGELRRIKAESHKSVIDSVTGLGNHRGLMERADFLFKYAARHQAEGANMRVDVIDVQGLGKWNKSPDQSTGDKVLQTVADALRTVSQRGTDYAARVGGDEFAVARENGSPNDTFIDRLREELAKPERYIDDRPILIHVGSAGMESHHSGGEVYETAQARMSAAKEAFEAGQS